MDALQKRGKNWQMSFNPTRREVLQISKTRNPIKSEYIIFGPKLAAVKEGFFIGVTISDNMSRIYI
ncbi:hypothetical protein DPMN_194381 [Dreissena polymorpha]|uniref:Uncharacterized protein n=1 Tax=Dreissena polymorpha TaxID=45954 RepID=A0A9D4B4X3_DREPO|nr:hypothetical protein DPMN_193544 [Dreissena polymorpha]KAH3689594.1 hypothetical protein DPMN_194381 [Dreissena polymorpha]